MRGYATPHTWCDDPDVILMQAAVSILIELAATQVYPAIRHKLSAALGVWHASDGSALALLRPWARAFAPADWDALLARSIAPKLAAALAELVINPVHQVGSATFNRCFCCFLKAVVFFLLHRHNLVSYL